VANADSRVTGMIKKESR